MKSLLLVLFLLIAVPVFAAEPVVIHNFDQPSMDASHGFDLSETLRLGGTEKDLVAGAPQRQFIGGKNLFERGIVHVACDSKGQIIVAEYTKNQIRKFAADGTLIGPVGKGGDAPDEYQFINAIAVDSKDNLYVVASKRILMYDADGKYVSSFRDVSGNHPRAVRTMPDGSVLLAEYDRPTNTVLQTYVGGKHEGHFGEPLKLEGQNADVMTVQWAGGYIDVGSDGTIYYTQASPYEIRTYTPSGNLIMRVSRDNDFVKPWQAQTSNGVTLSKLWQGCVGIFVLPDGKFLNVAVNSDDSNPQTVLDLFDAEGHMLLSHRSPGFQIPQWFDQSSNLYTFDWDDAAVVRSRLTIH
jgi:hypothetical protein